MSKELYKNRDWLEEEYVEKGLGTREIAGKTEVNESSIWRWLKRLHIPTREAGEPAAGNGKYRDKAWLREQYSDKDLSTYQIAKKVSSSAQTISRWLHEFGIETNKQPADRKKEEISGKNNPFYKKREAVKCAVCGKEMEILPYRKKSAKRYFCSKSCNRKWHRRRMKGSKNPSWKPNSTGGSYRGPNWQEQREKVLERDDHTCQVCGITQKELGKELDVHHIAPFSQFRYPLFIGNPVRNVLAEFDWKRANRTENLISVCPSCHRKVEGNEDFFN